MKKFFSLLLLLLLLLGCESNKRALMGTDFKVKKMSSKKIIRKHIAANFDKKTLDAKLKVSFNNGKVNQNFRVNLKMKKDEVIWMKGTKFITVFRLKITPTKVSYFSPYQKDYLEADFSVISKFLGTNISFTQLQNLLLGQAVFDLENKDYLTSIKGKSYELTPKIQEELFSVLFAVNPLNFKLDNQRLNNLKSNQRLEITYGNYLYQDKVDVPQNINILVKGNTKTTKINIEFKAIEFDKELSFPHRTPKNYKKIVL